MGFISKFKELLTLRKTLESEKEIYNSLEKQKNVLIAEIANLNEQLSDKEKLITDIKDVLSAENSSIRDKIIQDATNEAEEIKYNTNSELATLASSLEENKSALSLLQEEKEALQKEVTRYTNQARKYKAEVVGLKDFFKKYKDVISAQYDWNQEALDEAIDKITSFAKEDSLLQTIVKLPLHSDNSKELKKLSTATKKEINNLLEKYKERYNTKTNRALYNLMIVGLQAEMQLILFQLTYEKLSVSKNKVSTVLANYVAVTSEGNQSIKPTLLRFISDIEPLYMELVDIEYRYYIYRQREKEEQQAIKEQMRQEAEERKALEEERKKLDKEEAKYRTEMERNQQLLESETDADKLQQLQTRLAELQRQLDAVSDKKEEIVSLAKGKAGYVYIISNLGSFGENVFKIGMTRRLEPQQRIDELGSASVPFKFDVHAMIFSDDAVSLESNLHKQLSDNRVNKVNFRKEFFKSSIDDLESLVEKIDPTAEFIKTMYAEEYNQTLAIIENIKDINSEDIVA